MKNAAYRVFGEIISLNELLSSFVDSFICIQI